MRIVRYFFVGGVAACVDIALFTLFAKVLGYPYLIVAACTFVLATVVNYILSVRHVFQSGVRFSKSRELLLVFVVSLIGLGVNQAVLFVSVQSLGVDLVLGKLIATGAVFFWNYWARAHFVFKASNEGTVS
jgi:putative flippase GtrA